MQQKGRWHLVLATSWTHCDPSRPSPDPVPHLHSGDDSKPVSTENTVRLNLAFKKIDLLTLSSRRPVSWFGQGEAVSPPPTPHLSLQVRLGCLQPDLPFLQLRPLWDSEHTPDPRVASPGPCPTLDSLFPVLLIFPGSDIMKWCPLRGGANSPASCSTHPFHLPSPTVQQVLMICNTARFHNPNTNNRCAQGCPSSTLPPGPALLLGTPTDLRKAGEPRQPSA